MKLERHPLYFPGNFVIFLALSTMSPGSTPRVWAQDTVAPAADEKALQLIDEAMQTKLSATRLKDLDKVIELCEQAIATGLDEENTRFAKQMIASTLYERASRLIEPVLKGQIDISWSRRRDMAIDSLNQALEIDADDANALLLLAKLHLVLPGGDHERGRASADQAVKLLKSVPARLAEALVVRARYAENPADQLADLQQAVTADPENQEARRLRSPSPLAARRRQRCD